jgi:hypothetical protein
VHEKHLSPFSQSLHEIITASANDKYKRKIHLKSWVNALYKYSNPKVWLYVMFLEAMEKGW